MKYYYLLLLITISFASNAQTSSFDNWFGVGMEYNIIKPLTAKVKFGYRMSDFNSDATFIDGSLRYKVHKYLRIGIGWRYAGRGNPTDVDAITNRFHIEASNKVKIIKKLYLKSRLRYQLRFKDWMVSELGYIPKHSLRLRLLFDYAIHKRWTATIGGEFFTSGYYNTSPVVDPVRIISRIDYTIKKTHTLGLAYNIEQGLAISDNHTAHIIALNYSVNLNKVLKRIKKKKKKK